MAKVSTYLNFAGQTEEAFTFYQSIFGGEFIGGISRFSDMPPYEGMQPLPEHEQNMVLHMALPLIGDFVLMGSDAPESMGFKITPGNNMYINLEVDSKEQADELFAALSAGGQVEMPLADMFWGAYFGSLQDKFCIKWMINYDTKIHE